MAGTEYFPLLTQILCLAEQIQFTDRCEAAIKSNSLQEFQIEMESQLESYTSAEIGSSGAGDTEAHVLELKLKALILDAIHAIDVVQLLIKNSIKTLDDWMWQKQLRFYMHKRKSSFTTGSPPQKYELLIR